MGTFTFFTSAMKFAIVALALFSVAFADKEVLDDRGEEVLNENGMEEIGDILDYIDVIGKASVDLDTMEAKLAALADEAETIEEAKDSMTEAMNKEELENDWVHTNVEV